MKNKKWISGIIANYVSVVFISLATLICNFILASFYDSVIVGRFNFTLTLLLVLSQIGAMGCHQATMCFCAQDRKNRDTIFFSALFMVLIIDVLLVIVIEVIAIFFVKGPYHIWIILLGFTVPFCSLNKMVLGLLNGINAMRAYAYINTIRSILFILCSVLLSCIHIDGNYFFLCYTISELLTLVIGMLYIILKVHIRCSLSIEWMKKDILYGIRIMPSMISTELKTKGTILVMKLFYSDSVLGIYSFAMLFVEGFYQLYVILRINLNPKLAKLIAEGGFMHTEILDIKKQTRKLLYAWGIPAVLGVLIGYYFVIMFMDMNEYLEGMGFLAASLSSIALIGFWIVFMNCISFAGKPHYESFITIGSLIFDCICCYICIALGGTFGLIVFAVLSYLVYGFSIRMVLSGNFKGYNI